MYSVPWYLLSLSIGCLMFVKSRAKNKYFSTCKHHAYYTSCVYKGLSTTTRVHQDLCQKWKLMSVSMSWKDIYDPWPYIYWKISNSTLQSHFEGYKWANSELWKREKEFNFERKVALEKLFNSYWVCIPLSFKSEHSVQPPNSSLIDWEPHCLSLMSLPLVEDWSGGGPAGRNLVSQFWTMPTRKFVTFSLLLIIY